MDFYGILFDMKNGKKIPYSKNYFDTLFAAKLEELGVKTITGTLPLTFTISETALRSWTIYGNNTPHNYSAEGTLPLTFTTHTAGAANDWDIFGNDEPGTENLVTVADFTVGVAEAYDVFSRILPAGTYTVAVYQNTALTSAERNTLVVLKTSGAIYESVSTNYHLAADWHYLTFTIAESENINLRYWTANASNSVNCTSVMLVKGSTAPDHYIPYQQGVGERTITSFTDWESGTTITGYEQVGKPYAECKRNTSLTTRRRSVSIIPVVSGVATLNITSGYQVADIHFDKDGLYIGNPAAYHSNNYQISISDNVKYVATVVKKSDNSEFTDADVWDVYFTYSGANAYKIPLSVTSGQQSTQYTIYIGDTPLTAGQSISKTSTGVDIAAIAGTNTITTELYNKPEMSIEGVDYVGVGEPVNDGWQIPLTVKNTADLDRTNSTVGFLRDNGEIVTATDFITTDFIPVQANTHLKFTQRKTTSYDIRARLNVYNADKTLRRSYWEGIDFQADSWAFTIDITQAGYYRFCLDNSLLSSVETTTTYTIPIDAPLTEGQSVSDTVEITAYEGTNTLDTTLTVRPDATITYK